MIFTLLVILLPLVLVMLEKWRIDSAALFMIAAFGLAQFFGYSVLSDPSNPKAVELAISGFGQPVVITLFGLFILTHALTSNGVMLWIGQRLDRVGGNSESMLIFLFTLTSILLSLLMNNVAVGALLLPSAMQVAHRAKINPSKLLIPIAFGTALGGMATYFTTANIVMSNLLLIAVPPQKGLGFVHFFPVGGLIAAFGLLYLVFIGRKLLPDREPRTEQVLARRASDDLESLYSLGERLWEARVPDSSRLVEKTLKRSRIGEKFGLVVIAIIRGRRTIFNPEAVEILKPDDVLLIIGRADRVAELAEFGLDTKLGSRLVSKLGITLIELILTPHSNYEGKTIKQLNFRRKYGFSAMALLRRGRSYRTDVGEMALELGDSLLMIGVPERVRDLRANPDIIVLESESPVQAIPRKRMAWSVLILIGAVAASLFGLPTYLSVISAAVVAIISGLLPIREAYRSVEWQVIFFIAGMYVASLAMVHTGLAGLVGRYVIYPIESYGLLGLAAASFLAAAGLTQIVGSQATAFILGPVAISAAIHIGANPQAVAVATAIGCSSSFLTPTSHPVNLIMMNPGNYRFPDFIRVGVGLFLGTFLVLLIGLKLFWGL